MNDIGVDNIYVINVRSDVERRKHVENQLAQFKLKGEFIHECDIPDLNQQVLDAYFKEEDMSLAQKSCAMKHFSALKRILANGDRLALVLEDDVVFANDFVKSICLGLKEVESFTHPFVIFIGSGGNFYTPKKLRKPNQKLYKATRGRFADSYILDFRAAKIRADWIRRNKINQPIDNQFQDIDKEQNIEMLWLEDPVVEQGSKNGLFKTQLEPALPNLIQGFLFRWEKLRRKYLYQIFR